MGNGIEGVMERDFGEGDSGVGTSEGNENREEDGDERGEEHDLVSPTSEGDEEERRRRMRDRHMNGNGVPNITVSSPNGDSEGVSSPSEGGTL